MSQIFKSHTNLVVRILLLAGLAGVMGTFVFWTVWKWSDWETQVGTAQAQPVPFSHQHHVSGLGMDCRYCHTSVTRSAFAGLPPTHTCMTCHSQIWKDSPMLKPVRDSFAQGTQLRWNRVHRLPHYVYFNHQIHVNKGVGCTSCHGQIDQMPLTSKTQPFYMKDCLACHRDPAKKLRPLNEVFNQNWIAPKNQLEQGAKLVHEYQIPKKRLTDCVTCHR
jgi:hypothetical protein